MKRWYSKAIAIFIAAILLAGMSVSVTAESTNLLPGDGFKELLTNEFALSQEEIEVRPTAETGAVIPFANGTWNAMFSSATATDIYCALNYGGGDPFVVFNRTTSNQSYITSGQFDLTPGKTYRVAFDYRTTSNSSAAIMYGLHLIGKRKEPDTEIGYMELGYSTTTDNKWRHVEIYFTAPETQPYVNKAYFQFTSGSKQRAFCVQSPLIEECSSDALLWYQNATVEANTVNRNKWCNNSDSYGYVSAHIIQTNAFKKPVFAPVAGTSYTVIRALPDIVEAESGNAVMIIAQYCKEPAGVSLQTIDVSGAAQPEADASGVYARSYQCENVTVAENASEYKVFYRGAFAGLKPQCECGIGSILPKEKEEL